MYRYCNEVYNHVHVHVYYTNMYNARHKYCHSDARVSIMRVSAIAYQVILMLLRHAFLSRLIIIVCGVQPTYLKFQQVYQVIQMRRYM